MKILVILLLIGGVFYGMYAFMQQKKAEARQQEANAAVRYAQKLKADEGNAEEAAKKANAIIHQQDAMAKEAGDAQ